MNSLLARQLRRLGLSAEQPPADPGVWAQFLERIAGSYDDAEQSRYLLERSLHISSEEMRGMFDELQRASEAKQHEQENRLLAVIDSLSDGLCTLGLDGRVEFANAAAARMLASRRSQLIGTAILERFRFWPDEPAEQLRGDRILGIVATGHPFSDDTALLRLPDEQSLPVSCVLTPIGAPGAVTGIVFVFRDLTERQQTLEAMRRTERHYRTLFHTIPIAVYEEDFTKVGEWLHSLRISGVSDLDEYLDANPEALRDAIGLIRIRDVNPAVLDLVEADSAAQLLGPLDPGLFTKETLPSVRKQLLAIWEDSDTVHTELTGSTTRGNRLDAIFHWSVSRAGGRQDLSKVLVAMTDITQRKVVEEQMAALVEAKDEFIAAVSHELRTPLTAVYGSAEILADQDSLSAADRAELTRFIATESAELVHIIEDLLVAARADIGNLSVRITPIELAAEVTAALQAVSTAGIDRSIDTSGVSGRAMADALRFRQIMRNLLSNAVRYGGDTIRVTSCRTGSLALVRVTDDGAGIPESQWETIFEPYHRAHTRPGVPGSVGLGLTVARQLAGLMGGELTYRRHRGLSTFELALPAAENRARAVA